MRGAGGDPDRLLKLLPALYRIADEERGGPLKALLGLVTEQADALGDDIQQLWDDLFIETCQRWVVPYIGELVGNVALHDLDPSADARTAQALFLDLAGPSLAGPGAIRTRADVARTIAYRRRKGTPVMLEGLARDVTGWGAHVVEMLTLLGWTQNLEHLRPGAGGYPDLRRPELCSRVDGPWDETAHTVDVRRTTRWEGWHNVPNLGIFLWRLRAFPLTRVTPWAIDRADPWRLRFSPLGQDVALFCAGGHRGGTLAEGLADELSVQAPIRAAAFMQDLGGVPTPPPATASTAFYGEDASLVVLVDGVPVSADQVACRNLGPWDTFTQPAAGPIGIDVTRGRLLVPKDRAGKRITVSYHQGFSAPMGGGEYDRSRWLVLGPAPTTVSGGGGALAAAISAPGAPLRRIVEIADSATYDLPGPVSLRAGESLTIQAAGGARPHLRLSGGSLAITTAGTGASLTLSGLLVEGGLAAAGDLDGLRVLHSTLVPGGSVAPGGPRGPSLTVAPGPDADRLNTRLRLEIAHAVVGALVVPAHITGLWLLDSIVDGVAGGALAGVAVGDALGAGGPRAHIERSTLIGRSRFHELPMAGESIFTEPVRVERRQQGCMRFSLVPRGSTTPQQYRCQPALETALELERLRRGVDGLPAGGEGALASRIAGWLQPVFTSLRYGDAGYAQLDATCPAQIRTGAEDGSEMGAFCVLKQPQRESNLRMRLDEYLPVGLEAGIIHVT